MKCNAIPCGEYPVRVLFNDDRTLAWISLHDLCKVLERDELITSKEAIRQLPSAMQIPFRKNGREMWAISPYDVYRLLRPLRRENPIAAKNCNKVETWLNELLEEAAIQSARTMRQQEQPEDVVFSYRNNPISFRAANNRMMINATQMARSFGILPSEILRKAEFVRYRQLLVDKGVSESLDSQIFTTRGRNNGATWIAEELAMEFARHLSPEFSAWCNNKINELMTRGYVALEDNPPQGQDTADSLPIPQNLDDAQKLILAQRHEIREQRLRIDADAYKVEFYDNLIEGRDYYSTTWLAQELNTTPRQLHQFLAEKGICKFSKNQWVAFMPYRQWQIDMPYYWNNTRTGKCYAAGTRKRWSKAGRAHILELWGKEPPKRPQLPARRQRAENPYSHLKEGVDYFSPTQLAREIGISASRMSRFLEERGICRFIKKQWAATPEFAQWQIDVPYYWTNPKTGKRWAFGTRKRWTKLGREKIIELWNSRDIRQETEQEDVQGID